MALDDDTHSRVGFHLPHSALTMVITPQRLIRLAGIAIAITVGMAFSSSRASAACGDYLHIVGLPDESIREANSLPTYLDRERLPRIPCHGPGCSNRPSQSLPPLTVPVTNGGVKEVADHYGTGDNPSDSSTRHRVPRTIGLPIHFSTPVFDPPRLA